SHTTAQSLTFIELSLSAIRDTPLGRGPMSPPHSGPRPEFFGLHTLLRRLSGARSLPRLDLGLRLRGWYRVVFTAVTRQAAVARPKTARRRNSSRRHCRRRRLAWLRGTSARPRRRPRGFVSRLLASP